MKNKIFINDWLELKPQNYNGRTDLYYLKVANNVYASFGKNKLMLAQLLEAHDIKQLACFITCYFEDVLSETNIWSTFKAQYAKLYHKRLPFFNLDDDYIDDEINQEDVAFLIWYFINALVKDRFISPFNKVIQYLAIDAMEILEEEYEFAPVNKILKQKFTFESKTKQDEFYVSREFLHLVFFESYLMSPDVKRRLDYDTLKTIEDHSEADPEIVMSYIREITEDYTFNNTSALLALRAKDWAKLVLGKKHSSYDAVDSISKKVQGLFLYKSQDENYVFIEHIASGMVFEMTKKSFDHYDTLNEDDILYIGLVKFNDEWWFSGNYYANSFDADTVLDQRNDATQRSKVNFLNDQNQVESILEQQTKAFLNYNGQSLVTFLKTSELDDFINGWASFFNDSLELSANETDAAHKRTKEDGYFGNQNKSLFFDENTEAAEEITVVFFNPKSGIEFYNAIENAFPDHRNAFFTEESHQELTHILMSDTCSTELALFLVENYKDRLNYFKNEPYKSYLNDLDFLLRFWKKGNYETENTVVLT
ncbi:DUF3843 family protein, partial [Psychroserpens sp.]|uniref:DUF3843 family protein n=1 Tax=Psychroserpens sp. TaxID=2020870 RepID=UPI003C78564E